MPCPAILHRTEGNRTAVIQNLGAGAASAPLTHRRVQARTSGLRARAACPCIPISNAARPGVHHKPGIGRDKIVYTDSVHCCVFVYAICCIGLSYMSSHSVVYYTVTWYGMVWYDIVTCCIQWYITGLGRAKPGAASPHSSLPQQGLVHLRLQCTTSCLDVILWPYSQSHGFQSTVITLKPADTQEQPCP